MGPWLEVRLTTATWTKVGWIVAVVLFVIVIGFIVDECRNR